MSLFNTLSFIAASTFTSALAEAAIPNPRASNALPTSDPPRIVELPPSPQRPRVRPLPSRRAQPSQSPIRPPNMSGLPQNSIWTTMSYPIPRGPCLQKSSLISACSCQRFMVHPLKATSSFDCDGCGHHASFHRMKSHEEEVENAAKFRESMMNVQGQLSSRPSNEGRLLKDGRVEDVTEEDDETVDGDDYTEPEKKRRAVAARAGSETSEGGGRRGRKAGATVTPRAAGKRRRAGDQILIE
ncbi:hypothetical protein H072_6805 [Dactylellina haptotyla CBS 200.50]|uniref:CHY-type domain-containing protein n=1 Tax=Dactylellina haptotyla (strain CBS 200.50) TaxID=1284197 RepID=S8BVS7_DACHA|nr:hypothetical protein H072_6805 [Dactylellina haptotyla CBS 200.50]